MEFGTPRFLYFDLSVTLLAIAHLLLLFVNCKSALVIWISNARPMY
jgi:hypothetical protein